MKAILILLLGGWPLSGQASLRGLSAVNSSVSWAGGTHGTIQRTVDGGATWQRVSPADSDSLDFRDLEAFDESRAIAMSAGPGAASRLYSTSDGGRTWKLLTTNSEAKGFWDAIAFWDQRRGVLLGDPIGGLFDVRITSDGGVTWTRAGSPPAAREGEAAFAASGTCLIAEPRGKAWFVTGGAGGGRLLSSTDYGRTWRATDLPIAHAMPSEGAFSVAFAGKRGVVAGGNFQKPSEGASHIAYTVDGGRTWIPATGSRIYLSAVRPAGRLWIATGPAGTEISRDGGRSWELDSATGYHALSIGRDGSIWASGSDGRAGRYRPTR